MKGRQVLLISLILTVQGFALMVFEAVLPSFFRQWTGASFTAQVLSIALFTGGMAAGAWISAVRPWCKLAQSMGMLLVFSGIIMLLYPLGISFLQHNFPSLPGLLLTLLTLVWVLPGVLAGGALYPLAVRATPAHAAAGWLYASGLLGAGLGIGCTLFGFYGHYHLGQVLMGSGTTLLLAGGIMIAKKTKPTESPNRAVPQTFDRNLIVLAFILGMAGMLFQLNALRLSNLALGASHRTLGGVLLWILVSAGVGSLWATHKKSRKNSSQAQSLLLFIYAAAIFLSLLLYRSLFYLQSFAWHSLSRSETGYQLWAVFQAILPVLWIALPSFFNGFIFTRWVLVSENLAGKLYAAETFGTLVGAFTAYLVVIPLAGAIWGTLVTGLLMVMTAWWSDHFAFRRVRALFLSIILLVLAILFKPESQELFSGVFRTGVARTSAEVAAVYQGKHSTVAITFDERGLMSLLIDGKPDAGLSMTEWPSTDEPVEILLAALPLSFKPDAAQTAVVGLGSGITASILSHGPQIQNNDILEIEPAVVKAALNFGEKVAPLWNNPRNKIHIADARGWFIQHKNLYDIVVSEPSNPWVMGNSVLFTREFYQLVKAALNSHGIFVQWVQLYETQEEIPATILANLGRVFNDYSVYQADDGNLLVVAGDQVDTLLPKEDIFSLPELARHLTRLGIYSPTDLKIRKIGSKKLFNAWAEQQEGDLKKHDDLLPAMEPVALRALFMASDAYFFNDLKRMSAALSLVDKPGINSGISPYGYRLSAVSRAIKGKFLYDLLRRVRPDTSQITTPGLKRETDRISEIFSTAGHNITSSDYLVLLNDFCLCLLEFANPNELEELTNPFPDGSLQGLLMDFHLALGKGDRVKTQVAAEKILQNCNLWPQPVVEWVSVTCRAKGFTTSSRCGELDTSHPVFSALPNFH
ncbi:MAG: spermidine synthase [Bacteroidales bacterium]